MFFRKRMKYKFKYNTIYFEAINGFGSRLRFSALTKKVKKIQNTYFVKFYNIDYNTRTLYEVFVFTLFSIT